MAHRTLVDTYFYVKGKLELQEILSIRKQMCMAYLTWGYTALREEKEKFVELAKEFRIKEMKIGRTRTLLEKKARRLFKKTRKRKNMGRTREAARQWCIESQEKKIGVFSPEYQANLTEHNRRIRKIQTERNKESRSLDWIITTPSQEEILVHSMTKFCRENPQYDLEQSNLCKTAKFPGKTYKGWKARKYCPDFENL